MEIYLQGLMIGAFAFLCIGVFHPIVIKAEYYFTKNIWPLFAAVGGIAVIASMFFSNLTVSSMIAVFGISCLWSIIELFEQEKRVKKGWFPDGRKRKETE